MPYLDFEVRQAEPDRAAYKLAKEFVLERIAPDTLEGELSISVEDRPATVQELYHRLLASAQNANMKPQVIGGAIDGVHNLGPVLWNFDPVLVLERYASETEVLEEILDQLNPRGRINRTPKGLWPRYCRTILSGARFMSQFSSAGHFYEWVGVFDNERARLALPLLLAQEVDGLGFALACDFLKGLGYANFSKPDVHIKEIFPALGLCPPGASDYEVFKVVDRVARNNSVTPFNVDKLFWLIGSRDFGSRKKEFISMAQPELGRVHA
ncbi:MAG: hypothetical protein ACRDTR_05770 [Rubrobacter sp.]